MFVEMICMPSLNMGHVWSNLVHIAKFKEHLVNTHRGRTLHGLEICQNVSVNNI